MKKLLITVLVLLVPALLAYRYYSTKQNTASVPSIQVAQPPAVPVSPIPPVAQESSVKTYTMEEVATHVSDEENYTCWTVIHDKVYDITDYVNHPGGEQIYEACGKDATELFENRPDKGTPHPESAKQILEKYYIGDLKK